MQKQKIDSIYYLALQSTYENIQVALCDKEQLLEKMNINKIQASRDLILKIDDLLKKHNLSIDDMTFIGINKGPGPFTTLRVVIVTANALNFGGNLPLVGVNGLEALINETDSYKADVKVALLNAYNNDVYYAVKDKSNVLQIGYRNIDIFLNELKSKFVNDKVLFVGNGSALFSKEIKERFEQNAFIPENNLMTCSIEQVSKQAYENWIIKQHIVEQVVPVYLKEAIRIL